MQPQTARPSQPRVNKPKRKVKASDRNILSKLPAVVCNCKCWEWEIHINKPCLIVDGQSTHMVKLVLVLWTAGSLPNQWFAQDLPVLNSDSWFEHVWTIIFRCERLIFDYFHHYDGFSPSSWVWQFSSCETWYSPQKLPFPTWIPKNCSNCPCTWPYPYFFVGTRIIVGLPLFWSVIPLLL